MQDFDFCCQQWSFRWLFQAAQSREPFATELSSIDMRHKLPGKQRAGMWDICPLLSKIVMATNFRLYQEFYKAWDNSAASWAHCVHTEEDIKGKVFFCWTDETSSFLLLSVVGDQFSQTSPNASHCLISEVITVVDTTAKYSLCRVILHHM